MYYGVLPTNASLSFVGTTPKYTACKEGLKPTMLSQTHALYNCMRVSLFVCVSVYPAMSRESRTQMRPTRTTASIRERRCRCFQSDEMVLDSN